MATLLASAPRRRLTPPATWRERLAVVTGGSNAIGRKLADQLAAAEVRVPWKKLTTVDDEEGRR